MDNHSQVTIFLRDMYSDQFPIIKYMKYYGSIFHVFGLNNFKTICFLMRKYHDETTSDVGINFNMDSLEFQISLSILMII